MAFQTVDPQEGADISQVTT